MKKEQIERLNDVKADRDEEAVKKALADITECVRTKKGNLLDLAVKAAGLRATLGEISDACEEVVGRYKAVIRTISGVYEDRCHACLVKEVVVLCGYHTAGGDDDVLAAEFFRGHVLYAHALAFYKTNGPIGR